MSALVFLAVLILAVLCLRPRRPLRLSDRELDLLCRRLDRSPP